MKSALSITNTRVINFLKGLCPRQHPKAGQTCICSEVVKGVGVCPEDTLPPAFGGPQYMAELAKISDQQHIDRLQVDIQPVGRVFLEKHSRLLHLTVSSIYHHADWRSMGVLRPEEAMQYNRQD